MAKKKNSSKAAVSKVAAKPSKLSRLRLPRRQKGERPKNLRPLSSGWRLFRDSVSLVSQHWKLFGGMVLIYLVLTLILVGFGSSLDLPKVKGDLNAIIKGSGASLQIGVTLFGVLLASSAGGASSERGSAYQFMLTVMMSLAIIWSLRQIMAGKKIGLRDGFYRGMYPLVPFVLILLVIVAQLVPFFIGGVMFSAATSAGVASTLPERIVWGAILLILIAVSLYMITSSIFALYVVTLPDTAPMSALRSARELVKYRRWTLMRKLLFLPFILLLMGLAIGIPLALYLTPVAPWIFLILSTIGLIISHTYIYNLYRELL